VAFSLKKLQGHVTHTKRRLRVR